MPAALITSEGCTTLLCPWQTCQSSLLTGSCDTHFFGVSLFYLMTKSKLQWFYCLSTAFPQGNTPKTVQLWIQQELECAEAFESVRGLLSPSFWLWSCFSVLIFILADYWFSCSGSVGGKEPGSEQASCRSWRHKETLRSMTSLRRTIVIQALAQTSWKQPLYPLCFLKSINTERVK